MRKQITAQEVRDSDRIAGHSTPFILATVRDDEARTIEIYLEDHSAADGYRRMVRGYDELIYVDRVYDVPLDDPAMPDDDLPAALRDDDRRAAEQRDLEDGPRVSLWGDT